VTVSLLFIRAKQCSGVLLCLPKLGSFGLVGTVRLLVGTMLVGSGGANSSRGRRRSSSRASDAIKASSSMLRDVGPMSLVGAGRRIGSCNSSGNGGAECTGLLRRSFLREDLFTNGLNSEFSVFIFDDTTEGTSEN